MYTHNLRTRPVRAVAPARFTAGLLVTMALLSAACSDATSPINSPALSFTAAASSFPVLANAAVTCTDGTIIGDVGTSLAIPTGSVTQTTCPITGTVHVGDGVAEQAFNDFLSQYAALAPQPGDVCTVLTGTLAGVSLAPGAYCFDAAAALTGVLTLNGPSDGVWLFKIGTSGTGALTGTNFSVVMAGGGQASNVTWWVAQAATLTDSDLKGSILAGAAITLTRGTFNGNAWSKADVTITGTAVTAVTAVTVIIESLATITVTPNPVTLAINATQQFTAVGTDAGGNVVAIAPIWSVVASGGTIDGAGLFTAGAVDGTFPNTVQATSGSISGTATVVVSPPPPPPPPPAASNFAVLANAAVTCTDGTITGDVGTFLATPTGSVTQTSCPITGTVHVGDGVAEQAFNDFLSQYAALAPQPGDVCTTLTGTLAGVSLAPGAYCFDAAATLTGVLTLNGPSDGVWLFKIGTSGTGALTGTNFSVVMASGGQASNVTWRVAEAATLTDSDLKGSMLAGAAITLTRGTFDGNAWSKADVTITGTAVTGIITLP